MSYGNGIKLTAGFDVGAKTPLDSKSVVQTIAERDAFVTDNLVYEGLEVYVKDTGHKYRYNGTSWIDLDTQSGSESGTGEGLTTEQANQLTTAYEHSQTPHVSADDIPTNISDLTNDSGFITSIPPEYITETELETKGYLTEHQSLTDYAKKTDIPDVSDFLTEVPEGYVTDTKLSTELDKKVNKEVGKGLSTNDLTNELVIKINSSATEAFVTNAIANAQLGSGEVDLSGYATIDALNLKADLTHTHDQYLTKVPDEYVTETELTAKGYLTEHQDISNLALRSEIPDVSSFITSDDLPTVPTKTSDLTNDSGYLSTKDITSTINSTSADTQIPTAKSVNVAIKGKLITQEDIDTYGKEIIKFPVGKWTIGSVAINNLTDLPNSYVRYIEIIGISEATNPWTNNNTLRSYKATSYKGDTFLRSLNSGSEAGVIAFDTGWQRVLLNGDIIDNLTSTDTNKLLSANQGKILNDTKLNKTDANKLNCVSIDNVSLKEYILTNFTETEKTYYLIAKTTCTDLPKASNFYITVETPGLYTYKVTAKELNDSNSIYVCNYKTLSSTWTKWEKVCTTTVANIPKTDITIDTSKFTKKTDSSCISYCVVNGMCTIQVDGIGLVNTGYVTVSTGLPKPLLGNARNILQVEATATVPTTPVYIIIVNGNLNIFSGSSNGYFWGDITYPVAES